MNLEYYRFYKSEGMFESLSRTVTCTGELSALICVIPRGKDLILPCLDFILSSTVHGGSVVYKYPTCWTLTMNGI